MKDKLPEALSYPCKGGLLVEVCKKCKKPIRIVGKGLLHYECGCGSSLIDPNEKFYKNLHRFMIY